VAAPPSDMEAAICRTGAAVPDVTTDPGRTGCAFGHLTQLTDATFYGYGLFGPRHGPNGGPRMLDQHGAVENGRTATERINGESG